MVRATLGAAVIAFIGCLPGAADESPVWLAVTTPQLAPSLQPLAERRRSEGFNVAIVTEGPRAALAKYPRPAYLLLVGDAPSPGETADPAWYVATNVMPLYRWREAQRRTFASDARWGELDGDELPDVAVGRIPARTPQQAALVVSKILTYEDRPWTLNDLRFPLWQGSPNYGAAIDAAASMLTMSIVDKGVPGWGDPALMAALPGSAFCGWPPAQAATFNGWLRRGGCMALVAAHGDNDMFFSMNFRDGWSGYQGIDVERELSQGPPSCPLVILSCSTGNFIAPERCLTEMMLLAPGGPVAVAGATTESHPLTNALHGLAMARGFDRAPRRFGDLWLAGVRASHSERSLLLETMLANVEGSLQVPINVSKLRRDQMLMYAMLGDPATRIRIPGKLIATLNRDGGVWRWRVAPPPGATKLEVAFRRTRPGAMPKAPSELNRASAFAAQAQANAMLVYKRRATLGAGEPWEGKVDQPGDLRLVAETPGRWYVAVLKVGGD